MNKFKWTNAGRTSIEYRNAAGRPSTFFADTSERWQELQQYIAEGGQVDPWKTPEELLEMALSEKLQELTAEKNKRADAATGTTDSRKKSKMISRAVKLLRKEMKGQATVKEGEELDSMAVLDDYLDTLDDTYDQIEAWLEDPERTIEQISSYDVTTGPEWPQTA